MANDKRLIDANALLDYFRNEHHESEVTEAVKDAPTVDAVEVVHGRWQNYHYDPVEDCYVHVCSKCGGTNERMKPYCPNCGAKMDGDGNEP